MDTPDIETVEVNGYEWQAIDADDLRSYLTAKAQLLRDTGNVEEAGGVAMVIHDLFGDETP